MVLLRMFLLTAAVSLMGCLSAQTVSATKRIRIPSNARIVIEQPPDAMDNDEPYKGSGQKLANQLKGALLSHFASVEIGSGGNADWVIKPSILNWDDRETEWSGKPDRIRVALQVYHGRQTVGASIIEAKSSYWTLGGDHPEELLAKPFAEFAQSVAR